ncbi:cyclin-dependent kinase 5 activator 1-like [Salminus brasiliensis]|uniref:cyclin-dependent kinase 5 activator 1-like n=1 Tax=Salminus brasiliensis TaxID=930266 RepID=UPI003B832DA7
MVIRKNSTNELARMLGEFLCRRCHLIDDLSWYEPLTWLRNVDHFFYLVRWHEQHFLGRGSIVFIYMLCRDTISPEIASKEELKAVLLTCFYVSCAYVGRETSYPARPFMVEGDGMAFWDRTLAITRRLSGQMLRLNNSPQFFAKVFADLKNRKDH